MTILIAILTISAIAAAIAAAIVIAAARASGMADYLDRAYDADTYDE